MKNAGELYDSYSMLCDDPEELILMDFPEFKKALSFHDNELISEIEKKIEENQKKADTAISGNAIFFYDTKVIALTEIINLIKEK